MKRFFVSHFLPLHLHFALEPVISRRRLPAPPLILQPVLQRARLGSKAVTPLLQLAHFLQERGLLTDGGVLSLEQGLSGRGGVVSLTTQDVRASAHALTLLLLEEPDSLRWHEIAEDYYRRFDRGKPRRPTRLQRLFLEWSADLGPVGLLEACCRHPRLWEVTREALAFQQPDDPDRLLLELALTVRDSGCWKAWQEAFEKKTSVAQGHLARPRLLEILSLLPQPAPQERLEWLCQKTDGTLTAWSQALLLACRRPAALSPITMPESLIQMTLNLVRSAPGEVDPRWLAALRGYRWPASELQKLKDSLLKNDPIHRIVYGPRPGRPWLAELLGSVGSEDLQR